jgi:gluconokinase
MSARCFIVMGVAGCGKSSVARAFAESSGGKYLDADDFHPQENRDKMAAGIPLEDEDRWGWLSRLNETIKDHQQRGQGPLFLACSALKEVYRERMRADANGLLFLHLNGSFELIHERMKARSDHFMPAEMLQSQFDTLEEPEQAIWFDIIDPVEVICDKFFRQFPELKK